MGDWSEPPLAAAIAMPRVSPGQPQALASIQQIQVGAAERVLLAPLSGIERTSLVEETLPRADRPSAPMVNLAAALRRVRLARPQNRLALQDGRLNL